MEYEQLNVLANDKIQFGESLIEDIERYHNLEGLSKLSRKIGQELKFLRKVIEYSLTSLAIAFIMLCFRWKVTKSWKKSTFSVLTSHISGPL